MYKPLSHLSDGLENFSSSPSSSLSVSDLPELAFDPWADSEPPRTNERENESVADFVADFVACILDVIPDVERDHVMKLVTDTIETYGAGTVEHVLLTLFDDPKYPKVRKGRKVKEGSDITVKQMGTLEKTNCGFNYGDHDRPFTGGPSYADLTVVRYLHFH